VNNDLLRAIQAGELIIFLGAGASKTSRDSAGNDLLDGSKLAIRLAEEAGLEYSGESLDIVYSAARQKLESRLDGILERLYRYATPSEEYVALARHAWRRIYTLNIDDALDHALVRHSKQRIATYTGGDALRDRDSMFQRLDYIKLNGSIDRMRDGIIFSPSEYARATVSPMPWYEEVAADSLRVPILFIGTTLDEPLLKYHIERYKQSHKKRPGMGFVLTPKMSEIQRLDLQSYGLVHVPGYLFDFVTWLSSSFKEPQTSLDLAKASIPQLAELLKSTDRLKHVALFERVTHVNAATLRVGAARPPGTSILPFYKGFKPTWSDVIHGVPAELESLGRLIAHVNGHGAPNKIVPVVGPAGSGKTTLLMQAAVKMSLLPDTTVYFIGEPVKTFSATVEALEQGVTSALVVIVVDKFDHMSHDVAALLDSKRLQRTLIVGAERQSIWNKRSKSVLRDYATAPFEVVEFSRHDAEGILAKLSQYGSWTRLGQMAPKRRISELVDRARKQLLIAMLEATSGRGFEEIIEDEYSSLTEDAERLFLIVVGLATIHRLQMPVQLANRTLVQMGIDGSVSELSPSLSGIISAEADRLSARHPVYIRHLFGKVIDAPLIERAVRGVLLAFALNKAPVVQNLPKLDAAIYKATINHRFLYEVLNGQEKPIVGMYESLAKRFELDGLFWLQYGLALRSFGRHDDALEKLRTAVSAYSMDHTRHALAQQLIIISEGAKTKQAAYGLLDEAKAILMQLDKTVRASEDEYPIVTLAEGHTRLLMIWDQDQARQVAGGYSNLVKARLDDDPANDRLRECWSRLVKCAAVGTWVADERDVDDLKSEEFQ